MGSVDQKISELNEILDDNQKPYIEKIDALVSTWKYYYDQAYDSECLYILNHVLPIIHRSTLQVLLHGEWPRLKPVVKRKLTTILKRCIKILSRTYPQSAQKCATLKNLVQDPWHHPALHQIINNSATDSEVCNLMENEGSELIFVRLEALCEEKCEDLALKLAASYLKHMSVSPNCHQLDVKDLNDIVLALLYKFNKKQEVFDMLKNLSITDGVLLIRRHINRGKRAGRLWKHCAKVTTIASHTVLDCAMNHNIGSEEDKKSLSDLIIEWCNVHVLQLLTDDSIMPVFEVVRKAIQSAGSAQHIYLFAQTLNQQHGHKLRPLCIELYIRGLTANLNEIEQLKLEDNDSRLNQAEVQLAGAFLQLGELFTYNEALCRECLLTSFCVHPTRECLDQISTLAETYHSELKNDETHEKCSSHGNYNCFCQKELDTSIEINLDAELLQLAPHLPDDLSTLLSSPRSQELYWSIGWEKLRIECEKYLKEYPNNLRPKNKELRYLNIDYSQFKDWPKNVLHETGIEKGYELDYVGHPPKKRPGRKRRNSGGKPGAVGRPRKKMMVKKENPATVGVVADSLSSSTPSTSSSQQPFVYVPLIPVTSASSCERTTQTDSKTSQGCQTDPVAPLPMEAATTSSSSQPAGFKNCAPSPKITEEQRMNTGTSLRSSSPPIGSIDPAKTLRTFSRKNLMNTCCSYRSALSPKPAEVPPTIISDYGLKEKLKPILRRLNLSPKVVLTDIFSNKKACSSDGKTDVPGRQLDILAQAVMRSDILLAKSVPGMNSVDMIVPQRQETTVRVVQISNSNPVLSQSTPTTSVPSTSSQVISSNINSIQASSSNLVRSKPINDSKQASECPQSNQHECKNAQDSSSSSFHHHPSNVPTATANMMSHSNPRNEPRGVLIPPCNSVISGRNPPIKSGTPTSESSVSNDVLVGSSDVSNSFIASQQETPSTHISAHIQRVGQPLKLKKNTSDSTTSGNNPTASGSNQSGATQTNVDDLTKTRSSQGSSVYRLVVKDGRIVEQYYQGNQNLDPVLSIPDNDEETVSIVAQTFNHDHFIKLLKKKNEAKPVVKTENNKTTKESPSAHAQVSSLPKFHQVFGRQMYQQSGSVSIENSTSMSSHSQYEDTNATNNEKDDVSPPTSSSSSTVVTAAAALSKAVQTAVLKDNESPKKPVAMTEKPRSESLQKQHSHTSPSPVLSVTNASVGVSSVDVKENRSNDVTPSGVIFTCKVPISLSNNALLQGNPVTILKASSSSATDTIISSGKVETESRNKDSVIRSSNMNALLAAALQSSSPIKHTVINTSVSNPPTSSNSQVKHIKIGNNDGLVGMQKVRMPTPVQQKNVRRPSLVQPGTAARYVRPILQVSTGNSMTQTGPPVVTIPIPSRTVVLAANLSQTSIPNLSKIENRADHISSEQTSSVSSTTLEQLREFESVLEQVTNTSQMKERNIVKKVEHQPTQTTSTDFTNVNTSKVNQLFQPTMVSTISDLNSERVSLTFINKSVSTSTSIGNAGALIPTNTPKITATTPVVVVQSCSRPLASPALSVASQSSLSPAPQTPPAGLQAKIGSKVNKPKVKTSIGKTAPTTTIKVSSLPKPQQKPQEDEQTTQRIYAILDKYAEQLRNSPELKNKPAPRRRSNPPTNPTQSSKRKKSSHSKSKSASNLPACSGLDLSPGSEDLRTLGSEDSSNGVSQISQVLNSPQSRNDEHSNPPGGDVSSEASESLDSKDQRAQHRILLSEPSSSSSSRTVLVQENLQSMVNVDGPKVLAGKQLVVGSGATVPLTLSLPGTGNVKQVIFPVPTDGRPFVVAKVPKMYRVHQVTMPSGSPLLATASSGAVVLRQMCLNKSNPGVKQVKLPVVSQIPTQGLGNLSSQPAVVLPSGSQSFTLAAGSGIEGDSLGITIDNTILLNASGSSSLGFFQRSVSKPPNQQSSNLLTTVNRTQENPNPLISTSKSTDTSPSIKTECSTLPIQGSSANIDEQGKVNLNVSEQRESEFNKSDEIRFSIASERSSDKQLSDSNAYSSQNAKSWVQLLKDTKSADTLLKEVDDKNMESDVVKREFQEKSSESSKEVKQITKTSIKNESVIKMKNQDSQFGEVEHLLDLKQAIDTSKPCLNIQNKSNDQWHFSLNKDKVICKDVKTEPMSASPLCEQPKETPTLVLNNATQTLGMKRKLNVENTIFQVAFKRADKLKIAKDEFIHQRNTSIALERELRLQKSLSEECEDLGVDKPSTSDLFPEAELLLDSDPLSRDSLQELYSRGMESSSSSHGSPNRSPDLPDNRFSSPAWRKHKNSSKKLMTEIRMAENPLKSSLVDSKSDSSCESNPLNGGSGPSTNDLHIKSVTNRMYKQTQMKNDNHSGGIVSHDSDNCNFSEVEEHIGPDLIDSDVESNSGLNQSSFKSAEFADIHESESNDKTNDLLGQSQCNNCTYHYNSFKGKLESNLPWFNIGSRGVDGECVDKNTDDFETECTTPNGLLLDDIDNHKDCDGLCNADSKKCRSVSSPVLRGGRLKRRRFGGGDEDSGSSTDALLAGSPDELDIERLRRRSSSRGRVKKGCPCFNGSPEPNKHKIKKDLVPGTFVKTDRPCKTHLTTFTVVPTKKAATKPTLFKNVTKKR